MPHVTIKLYPGKTEEQKIRLTEAITREMMEILGSGTNAISVGFEEIASESWKDEVYLPEIKASWDRLYKKPGYEM